MPVSDKHPEYRHMLPRYDMVRAIINNRAECYIRQPDKEDTYRNKQYVEDGVLTNFTNFTCEALLGLVFSNKLKLSLPDNLSYLLEDITGAGINLWQFSQYAVSELLQTGRLGLLVDYDNDAQSAFIKPYAAESIINWKTANINGIVQPWLIVLEECITLDDEDIFSQEQEVQYRVLKIDEDGVYRQYIYNSENNLIKILDITDNNGYNFDYIPFIFAGSVNNDWAVDKIPLYDLARINLQHYRNSCDLEESIFINGQPYVHVDIGESNADDFKENNPNGIEYGSRKGLITQKGRVDLIQANPNQLVSTEMDRKLAGAAKIGARLIELSGGRETAEAARIRFGSQFSVLYTLTSNLSWAIEAALRIVCEFMGANKPQVRFKLNDEFIDNSADGNIMTAYLAWFDRGIVSARELRDYGRKVGIIDENTSDAEIQNQVDVTSDPLFESYVDDELERRDIETSAIADEISENSSANNEETSNES